MASDPEMPDYYRILQVHPEADPEVIQAAYHRLIKKYHPDAIGGDDAGDQQTIREINAAYEVLGDPAKRAAYDASLRGERAPGAHGGPLSTVEKRTIAGKCAKTGKEFDVLLARKRGSDDKFKVVGFTPVEPTTEIIAKPAGPLAVIGRVLGGRKKGAPHGRGFGTPSDDELEAMFDEDTRINFSDIAWGMRCPVCNGAVPQSGGGATTWSICGSCKRISCMGNVHIVAGEMIKLCPWCGSRHKIKNLDKTGARSTHSVQSSAVEEQEPKRLGGVRQSLPDGENRGE